MTYTELTLSHPNLCPAALAVYLIIADAIEDSGNNSTLFPIDDICRIIGMTDRSVRTYIRQLHNEGLLEISKQGKNNCYSLANLNKENNTRKTETQKTIPENNTGKTETQKIIPENNTGKYHTYHTLDNSMYNNKSDSMKSDIFLNNIILKNKNISVSEISDSQIQIKEHPVRRQYNRLLRWKGSIQRGKIEISPEDLAQRMAALTPDILDEISAVYDRSNVEHPTAWIQAALLHPWDTIKDPRAALFAPKQTQAQKPKYDKIHFSLERKYDFDELDEQIKMGKFNGKAKKRYSNDNY